MVMKDVRVVGELKKTGPVSQHRVEAIHEGLILQSFSKFKLEDGKYDRCGR